MDIVTEEKMKNTNLIEDVLKTIYLDCLKKDIEQDINHFLQKIDLLKELQKALIKVTK